MDRRRNYLESLDDRLDAIERQSTRRNPRNLEWRRAPERQTEPHFSGEEPDEPNDCIITIENEGQRNVGMRKKNSSLSNDYSRPTKKNTTRNERQVSFDLRGSPRSIRLFEDVDVEDFKERGFGPHHQFEKDVNIGVRNQDIRNTRTVNARYQELEPNVQVRRKRVARKQRVYSDDNNDNNQCNDTAQAIKRNTHRPTEKSPKHGRAIVDESDIQMGEEMSTNGVYEFIIERLREIQEEVANQEGDIEIQAIQIKILERMFWREERERLNLFSYGLRLVEDKKDSDEASRIIQQSQPDKRLVRENTKVDRWHDDQLQIENNCESCDKNVGSLLSDEAVTFDAKSVDTAEASNNMISIPQLTRCLEANETSAYKAKECNNFIILDGNSVWTHNCSVSGSENDDTTEYTSNPGAYNKDDNQNISETVNSESSLFEIKSVAGSLNRSFMEEPSLFLEQKKDSSNLLEEAYEVEQGCSTIAEDFERRGTGSTISTDVTFEEHTCCIESSYVTLLTAEDLCSDNCGMKCEVHCEGALVALSPVDDNIDKHHPGRGQNLLSAFMGVRSSMGIQMKSQAITLEMNVCDVIKLASLEIRQYNLQSETNKCHVFRGMDFEYSNHPGEKEKTTWSHESL